MTQTAVLAPRSPTSRGNAPESPPASLPAESELTSPDDLALRHRLRRLVADCPDFWDFGGTARRKFAHGYFHYPAMMVPNMVGCALDEIAADRGQPIHLLDPFAGSGTVVTEAVARGWEVTAVDVNPLAALLCRVKGGPFFPEATAKSVHAVLSLARSGAGAALHEFHNIEKWFEPEVIRDLSVLRRAIMSIDGDAARRFLWVALAETVRLTSNSRLSTVKLHIKPVGDRVAADALGVFERIALRNLELMRAESERLRNAGHLRRGHPTARVRIVLGDVKTSDLRGDARSPNLLVTSPPYGDNQTTITYGQHAYLPLQWIDLLDTGALDRSALCGPSSIDSASLGGRRLNGRLRAAAVRTKSEAADATLNRLAEVRPDHADKVGAFLSDLDQAFDRALGVLADGSHVVVTIGDRTVSGMQIPTARIVQDLVAFRGGDVLAVIPRRLPSARRMAPRNKFASRMETEWMLVMRLPK